MTNIITDDGENWGFDPDTKRLFKDGKVVPDTEAEPVYVNLDPSVPPEFSGIYVKAINSIISLSGKVNRITNIN